MNYLLLIRHSLPDIRPNLPADHWCLSPLGRSRSQTLATRLEAYPPDEVVTSLEPKSIETGKIIADHFSLTPTYCEGLREHVRDNEPYTDSTAFESRLAAFFSHPDDLVYGRETAAQVLERFSTALDTLLTKFPSENLAVVTHGTILTCWAARQTGADPFSFWKTLTLPALLIFSRPGLQLVEQINHVE